jgi:hypothetical protein
MLLQLITRARRRLFWNALAAEGVRAATIAVALLALLLLLGTDILGWHWLIAMPVAAFAAGFYFAVHRLPGQYQTARIVDTRLRLYDVLATALFFSRSPSATAWDAGMRRAQADRAQAASENVHLSEAVPIRAPRLLYAALPLALLACSLFLLRYAWQDRLDLRQPMPAVSRLLMQLSKSDLLSFLDRKEDPPKPPDRDRDQGRSGKDRAGEGDRHDDAAHGTPANQAAPSEKQQDGAEKQRSSGQTGEQNAQQQQQQQQQNSQSQDSQEASNGEPRNGANRDQANQNNTSSSLMSKLSNAVQNMLSRLGSSSSGNRKGEASRSQDSNQQNSANGQRSNGQPGMQQSSGQSASASQSGESGQPRQGMQTMGTGKSGESRDRQPGSSAGSNDGAKDVKQAEQLAAMGKLSVILGQRSDKLTGSTTVETVSGTQTLVTPYAGARNAHAETGALIHHDEVPVTVQDYVERYFAAVRSRPERVARRMK